MQHEARILAADKSKPVLGRVQSVRVLNHQVAAYEADLADGRVPERGFYQYIDSAVVVQRAAGAVMGAWSEEFLLANRSDRDQFAFAAAMARLRARGVSTDARLVACAHVDGRREPMCP